LVIRFSTAVLTTAFLFSVVRFNASISFIKQFGLFIIAAASDSPRLCVLNRNLTVFSASATAFLASYTAAAYLCERFFCLIYRFQASNYIRLPPLRKNDAKSSKNL
jgi:hypothetical protein